MVAYNTDTRDSAMQVRQVISNGLYGRMYYHFVNFAIRLGVPSADAEDVVQDSFFNALRRAETFVPSGVNSTDGLAYDITTWLYGIIRNRAMDYLRINRKRAEVSLRVERDEDEVWWNEPAADVDQPLDVLVRKERAGVVRDGIERQVGGCELPTLVGR